MRDQGIPPPSSVVRRTKTPGIYKRGGSYVVVWKHRGKQHKSFHRTYAEAREAKGQRAQRGERAPVSRETFEEYARRWIDAYQGRTARGLSERTHASYRESLEKHAIPHFRGMRLADIEPPDVRGLVTELLRGGRSAGTASKDLAPVKALFATAVEDRALRYDPCAGVRVNARRTYDPDAEEPAKALTRAELARLLKEMPGDWRLLFELLAKTGLRISEALGLEWRDLAQANGRPVLRVRRQFVRGTLDDLKSANSRRDVPLPPMLATALTERRNAADPVCPLIFPSATGTYLADRNVRKRVLLPAATRAGVPHATGFHIFRHTYASLLIDSGELSPIQIGRRLGHASPAFTMRVYGHLMDDGLGGADFLDEGFESPAEAKPDAEDVA